jgi:hypothetical protein
MPNLGEKIHRKLEAILGTENICQAKHPLLYWLTAKNSE